MDIVEKEEKIGKLRSQIEKCTRCELHQTRTNTVTGEGHVDADIMFIGEAPGRNEDLQGKPFIGRAGSVFDQLLESIALTRDDIYLCNILKCRPPKNRNPLANEIQACVGSLDMQIKIVQPRIIAMLGSFATTYIFEKFSVAPATITSVAGQVFNVETIFGPMKLIPLFHPAVATYNSTKIDVLLNDFQSIKKSLEDVKNQPLPKEAVALIKSSNESQLEIWNTNLTKE